MNKLQENVHYSQLAVKEELYRDPAEPERLPAVGLRRTAAYLKLLPLAN